MSVPNSDSGLRVVALLCAAEAFGMAGFSTYPALLAPLREGWGMSGAEAGFIGGVFFAGYMAAVPLLSALTDRVDARRVYFFSTLLAAAGTTGFGLFAQGVASAAAFQALAGAGLAGTYMPGLKALTDRVGGPLQGRFIAFYTSTFGIGASASLVLAGALEPALDWRWAFILSGAGPLAAGLLVLGALEPMTPERPAHAPAHLLDPRPVLRDRAVLGYVLGYAAHCWELFGLRAWLVAFIAFAYALAPHADIPWGPAAAAAAINLLGIPASILGNEIAGRVGRRRYIVTVMACSALLAWAAGFAAAVSWGLTLFLLSLHFVAVMATRRRSPPAWWRPRRPGNAAPPWRSIRFWASAAASSAPSSSAWCSTAWAARTTRRPGASPSAASAWLAPAARWRSGLPNERSGHEKNRR